VCIIIFHVFEDIIVDVNILADKISVKVKQKKSKAIPVTDLGV
jgi:hypothetical protein